MSYGCTATGFGAPAGGATSNWGDFSTSPSSFGSSTGSALDLGSTFNSNFWGVDTNLLSQGLGHISSGLSELGQSGALGGGSSFWEGTGGSSTMDLGGGTSTSGSGSTSSFNDYCNSFIDPNTGTVAGGATGGDTGTGAGTGTQGGTGGANQYQDFLNGLTSLEDFIKNLSNEVGQIPQAPAPAPVDPVANLVNQANVDPALLPAVTQIANNPTGNALLQGAVNNGLQGIQLANLPAGFFGQFLPNDRLIQIAPSTINSGDLVRTLAHELVHASTVGNGNSLNEEGLADRLGTQIQQAITGFGPGYVLGGNAYNGLPQDNGIVNALRFLGINV